LSCWPVSRTKTLIFSICCIVNKYDVDEFGPCVSYLTNMHQNWNRLVILWTPKPSNKKANRN
jgi:hypothetical protein